MPLRPYQKECLEAIRAAHLRGVNRQLVLMPTASGKAVVAAHLLDYLSLNPWESLLFMCHTDEQVSQAVDKFRKYNPDLSVEIEKAGEKASANSDIVVASVQSLCRPDRLARYDPEQYPVVLVDECHHAPTPTVMQILQHFRLLPKDSNYDPTKIHIGFTATATRADGVGLETIYQQIVFQRSILDMIRDPAANEMYGIGWLVPPEVHRIDTQTDISKVKKHAGDFAARGLSTAINTPARNQLIVEKYEEIGKGLPAIAFTADVQHAIDLAAVLRTAGYRAYPISGTTPLDERRKLIAKFKNGEIDVITNVAVVSEGTDLPIATVGIDAAPTLSQLRFTQKFGRVERPYPAPEERGMQHVGYIKNRCIWLDFVDSSGRHDLVTAPTLFGLPPKFQCRGRAVTEVLDQIEQLQIKYPTIRARDYTSVEEMRSVVSSVDLFKPPEVPAVARKNGAKMVWLEEASGVYRLSTPEKVVFRIKVNHLGGYEVSQNERGSANTLRVFDTPREAFAWAEQSVPPASRGAVLRAARWRGDPPTESQCMWLWKRDKALHDQFAEWRALYAFAYREWSNDSKAWTKGALSRRLDVLFGGY